MQFRIESAKYVIVFLVLANIVDKYYMVTFLSHIDISIQLGLAILISGLALIEILSTGKINKNFLYPLIFALFMWFMFEGLRSVDMMRGITYILMLAIGIFIFIKVSSLPSSSFLLSVNKNIFVFGGALHLLMAVWYSYILLFNSGYILDHPTLWDVGPSAIYEVQLGTVIAFQGLIGDPNAVGVGAAIVLFCGLQVRFKHFDLFRHIINFIMILLILASNSRGALVALIISFVFGCLFFGDKEYKKYFLTFFFVIVCLAALSWVSGDLAGFSNPVDKIDRGAGQRMEQWGMIVSSFVEQPIIGNGLRSCENLLSKYPENSYLTLLNDSGIIGAVLYCILWGFPLFMFISHRPDRRFDAESVIPWIVYSVFLLLSMGYISMEVRPIVWMTLGIIAGPVLVGSNLSNECRRLPLQRHL